ncbi:MAG: hypothetical protein JWQ38_1375 [Flavipsychrobacter sp.]|nr:hypothetical protein [Flavipsychrobacter sp.]
MFIIIFSFQVLPVRVLGKLLAKGQTEEEVKNSDSDDSDNAAKYLDFLSCNSLKFSSSCVTEKPVGFVVNTSDDVPASYVSEILSPPPNC